MRYPPRVNDSDVRLSSLLGRGRHGTVFAARAELIPGAEETIAVKIHHCPERAREEYDILVRFDHPHIVSVVAEPLSNGSLLLEYCRGGTVGDRLDSRRFTTTEVRRLLVQITDALTRLHDAGWIHGDVSPRNIAFRDDGTPVLIDFTTARPSDAAVIDEGTDEFTGPVRLATPTLDARALAATALVALGDERAWDRADVRFRTHLLSVIERADGGETVAVEELLAAGLTRVPDVSTRGAPALRTDITRSFGPRPGEPSTALAEATAPARRRQLTVVALLFVALAALVGERAVTQPRHTAPASVTTKAEAATTTLDRASAKWDPDTGTLRVEVRGAPASWHVGRAGDLAAVGDWDCSGVATLGVYRPSTGSWFTFSSWEDDATSRPPRLVDVGRSSLDVGFDDQGCAEPQLR